MTRRIFCRRYTRAATRPTRKPTFLSITLADFHRIAVALDNETTTPEQRSIIDRVSLFLSLSLSDPLAFSLSLRDCVRADRVIAFKIAREGFFYSDGRGAARCDAG